MKEFIRHDLAKNTLECKGCYERVEIPRRVLQSRMPQEAVLIFKQAFAAAHIEAGCDEAADKVAEAAWSNRSDRDIAKRVLGL